MQVVVTGMGILSSIGQGIPSFKKSLFEGKSQFGFCSKFPSLSFPVIAAELEAFDFNNSLPQCPLTSIAEKAGRRAPFTVQTSLVSALEAWHQARLPERNIDSHRIGLIVAGQNTTAGYQQKIAHRYREEIDYLPPSYALHFMDTDQVGTLSEVFKIQGEGYTVGGASASGNAAIINGTRLILQNIVDVCLIVGVAADLSEFELQGFHNIGAMGGRNYEPGKACRPFDQGHEGFIWGQASASLILESKKIAARDKIPCLGEIAGSAMVLDGNRSPSPNSCGESRAMLQALTNANLKPEEIHYINTHGSSSPLGDITEIKAIQQIFGDYTKEIYLNSTKGLTGHCLWSAGVVETIATLLQLQEQCIHPNLNLQMPIDPICRFAGEHSVKANIRNALSNSFGFGGINTSIVLTSSLFTKFLPFWPA